MGGSMADTTSIRPEEVLQRREGLRTIPKLFSGKHSPTLTLHSVPITTFDTFDRESIDMLPPTMITTVASLPLLRCYRTLFLYASNNTHVVSEPALNIFPYVLDHPSLFEMLVKQTATGNRFTKSSLKTTFKQSSKKALDIFKKEVLKFWPAFCDSRAVNSRHSEGHDGHDVHLARIPHGSMGDLTQALVSEGGSHPGCPFPDPNTREGSSSRSKHEVLYTPFQVNEVILNMPSNQSAINGLLDYYK